jgi:two-component system OmpR family response regulator
MARILIVDDDFDIVSLLVEILNNDGHEVHSASEPVEGMQKSRLVHPDLIILDYHMPGTTGAHLFESFRRNQATLRTPILFMSGEASANDIYQEIADPAGSLFLAKPVHLDDFRAAVKELLSPNVGQEGKS